MALTAGIIGLPNVGKSTLFNAITKSQVEAANYPFATIDPNVGVVEVPDYRLNKLVNLMVPENIVATTFTFTDIAGLVKGASKGEGLGNKFLETIKNTDAICHVVRCFEDSNITHVENTVDPIRDIEIINLELIFKDSDIVTNVVNKIRKKAFATNDVVMKKEVEIYEKILVNLGEGKLLRTLDLSKDALELIKPLNLITLKPVLYVANIAEIDIGKENLNKFYLKVKEYALANKSEVIAISAKIESELTTLSDEDKKIFMSDIGLEQSGLDKLIKSAYELLDLKTFFTAGKKEVRAWTFKNGYTAPECAGIIHTDFQKGFIRAEVMKYEDLILFKTEKIIKEVGKWASEGKEYKVKDGDVILFRFNV